MTLAEKLHLASSFSLLDLFFECLLDLVDHVPLQAQRRRVALASIPVVALILVVVPAIVVVGWNVKFNRVIGRCDRGDIPFEVHYLAVLVKILKRNDEEQTNKASRCSGQRKMIVLDCLFLCRLDTRVLHEEEVRRPGAARTWTIEEIPLTEAHVVAILTDGLIEHVGSIFGIRLARSVIIVCEAGVDGTIRVWIGHAIVEDLADRAVVASHGQAANAQWSVQAINMRVAQVSNHGPRIAHIIVLFVARARLVSHQQGHRQDAERQEDKDQLVKDVDVGHDTEAQLRERVLFVSVRLYVLLDLVDVLLHDQLAINRDLPLRILVK